MEIPTTVLEEIKDAKEAFPQINIVSATNSFLSGSYGRTPSTRIKFTLTFPSGYPEQHALIADITTDNVVPPGLKKKLEKEFTQDLPVGHYQQIILVFQKLIQFVDGNKFLPCWRELKQCINLVKADTNADTSTNTNTNTSAISIIESKGKIKLKLAQGKYYYRCNILIDDGYPSTTTNEDWGKPCILNLETSNFPSKIETMLTSQAKELIRRLQDGMTSDDALRFSNPIQAPKDHEDDNKKKKVVKVRLTQSKLKSLEKDMKTLSVVRELREVNATKVQGKAHVLANAARDRKDARRTIKKITKEEIKNDTLIEEEDKRWQEEENARLKGYNIAEHDGSNPQPSLLSLITFLKEKIQKLPNEVCPSCQKVALPSDPDELKALYVSASECKTVKEKKARKAAKAKRPLRTYCGHWWHYACLNKYMVEPPFGLSCPAPNCGRRVYHPDWTDDIKQLERAWAGQQAREREILDAAMFL